jgi:hypothetical protein
MKTSTSARRYQMSFPSLRAGILGSLRVVWSLMNRSETPSLFAPGEHSRDDHHLDPTRLSRLSRLAPSGSRVSKLDAVGKTLENSFVPALRGSSSGTPFPPLHD